MRTTLENLVLRTRDGQTVLAATYPPLKGEVLAVGHWTEDAYRMPVSTVKTPPSPIVAQRQAMPEAVHNRYPRGRS